MTNTTPIPREVLEDRWTTATIAPWRPGLWSKLGERLHATVEELVERVAMIDMHLEANRATPEGNRYPDLVLELELVIRTELIRRLDERGLARTGYEQIGDVPEPVR